MMIKAFKFYDTYHFLPHPSLQSEIFFKSPCFRYWVSLFSLSLWCLTGSGRAAEQTAVEQKAVVSHGDGVSWSVRAQNSFFHFPCAFFCLYFCIFFNLPAVHNLHKKLPLLLCFSLRHNMLNHIFYHLISRITSVQFRNYFQRTEFLIRVFMIKTSTGKDFLIHQIHRTVNQQKVCRGSFLPCRCNLCNVMVTNLWPLHCLVFHYALLDRVPIREEVGINSYWRIT